MNPFKGGCGKRSKHKSKCTKVEVKQEPSMKEEPDDGDCAIDVPRPEADGEHRVNYRRPIDFDDDFDEVKDEIKYEKKRRRRSGSYNGIGIM